MSRDDLPTELARKWAEFVEEMDRVRPAEPLRLCMAWLEYGPERPSDRARRKRRARYLRGRRDVRPRMRGAR